MPIKNIVRGQAVTFSKLEKAKEMRANQTEAELVLWQVLRANRFQGLHFRRQQVIGGFIVDFYCHVGELVIEVDGPIHAAQKEYDAEREQVLTEMGLRVLRVSNEDVLQRLPQVLKLIEDHSSPSLLGKVRDR